ncbi:MAG: mechanosensitive ion channel [Chloroflexi bacterium]|nr:mechanosensitive ion channel [Chloroflexota bacterium]
MGPGNINWFQLAVPLVGFLIILAAGYALWRFSWAAFDRWADRTPWLGAGIISEAARRPSFVWFFLISLLVAVRVSGLSAMWQYVAGNILWSVLVVSVVWVAAKVTGGLFDLYSARGRRSPAVTAVRRIGLAWGVAAAVLIILDLWGIPITTVLLMIGIAIAFTIVLLRNVLPDIYAGIQLNATEQVKKHDYIKLGTGEEGYVVDISLRTTQLRAIDESLIIVANSKLIQTTLVNYGRYSLKAEYDKLKVYTDRIEALIKEVTSQRDEIQAILTSMAEGIIVLDPANRIVSLNPAAERFLGRTAEELAGRNIDPYLQLAPGETTAVLARQAAGSVFPLKRRVGDLVLSVNIGAVKGQSGRTICAIQDITELDRLDRMKTEFVSMVSHELRTPLTSIKGYVEMVLAREAGDINDEQRSYLEVARSNTDRLIVLVNDLLDISRIEAGKVELNLRPVALQEIVESVALSFRNLIEEKAMSLTLDMPETPLRVLADGSRLAQVLTNLLSNARNYSPRGASITVRGRIADAQVRVDVRDTGIGISEEDQKRIFTKFFRADNPATRQVSGTGLGLSVARSLVEMQGGRIWVDSAPGQGSTFSFTVPLLPGVKTTVPDKNRAAS